MARFFLHQRQGSAYVEDLEGENFAGPTDAPSEALAAAREIMSETLLKQGVVDLDWSFEITDEAGSLLDVVRFDEAIELRRSR